jgi:hypothetical protein
VNSTYDAEVSAINTLYNRKYHAASDAAASAKAGRRWYEYLFYHESPWRRGAFTAIEAELTHPEYWELLGNVWTQCDAPFQERPHWVRLWRSPRPGREFSMEQGEREAFGALPDRMTIYRGVDVKGGVCGLSWTLDQDQARWFAMRWATPGRVTYLASGEVEKPHVLAYFTGRNEGEIVVIPDHIRNMRVERVAVPDPKPANTVKLTDIVKSIAAKP